jgi:hypothetical protein
LFTEIFFTRHNLVPRHFLPHPIRLRTAAESVPGEKYKSELWGQGRTGPPVGAQGQSLPRSLPVSL